jgi:mannosyl-glycoprotein endo-beta-N-acetylglucosaminidase
MSNFGWFFLYYYIELYGESIKERGELMKNHIWTSVKAIFILSLLLLAFPKNYEGYTDLSTYKIQTGKFIGEDEALAALNRLNADTGLVGKDYLTSDYDNYQIITGGFSGEDKVKEVRQEFFKATGIQSTYSGIGDPQSYYLIITGGFSGKFKVIQVLQKFKSETGIAGQYYGIGNPLNYYQIISGSFSGETTVKKVVEQLKDNTGVNSSYVGIGEKQDYYQISSGGFSGETRVKNILQQFVSATGIKATYIGLGSPQNYYQIISGGFTGESNVKKILQQFEASTGINATYAPLGNNRYQIRSEDVLGMTKVNIGRNFFTKKNWSVTYKSTGQTGYERYQIKSDPVFGLDKVNEARGFFKKKNWSVTYKSTGQTGYERYQVKSEPVLGLDKVNEACDFFKKNKWSVTYQSTGQTGYERYQIKSEPVLGMDKVNEARDFFKKNNWSVTYQSTGQTVYDRYQIISEPILGMYKVNEARDFFKKHNWSATYKPTGKLMSYYQIIVDDIVGSETVNADIQKIKQMYGWNATAVKTKNGPQLMYTDYGLSLSSMLDKEMALNPQTDKYRNDPRYVYAAYVDLNKQIINADHVNVRTGPSTSSTVTQQLNTGNSVLVVGQTGDWVEIRLTWQNAQADDVSYYLNPNNFSIDSKDYFQFLKLSQPANLNADEVNQKILSGKGILAGKAQYYIDAANQYGVNDVYLLSHSILETGNGASPLANGVEYNGKTVYNMYGYGAFDSCPETCGAKTAYDNGWFTPQAAILGGAKLISQGYIYNDTFQQDTLYKMRWNPVTTWHQYASDIGWAYKQISSIYNIYQLLDDYTLYFDVPSYR